MKEPAAIASTNTSAGGNARPDMKTPHGLLARGEHYRNCDLSRYGVVGAGVVVVLSAGAPSVAASAASPASSCGPWPRSVVPVVDCSYWVSAASPASSFGPWLHAAMPSIATA